jgi:hypothetical protein
MEWNAEEPDTLLDDDDEADILASPSCPPGGVSLTHNSAAWIMKPATCTSAVTGGAAKEVVGRGGGDKAVEDHDGEGFGAGPSFFSLQFPRV